MNSTTTALSTSSPKSDKRLYALDLARFVAMIMMMQGHTLDSLVSSQFLDTAAFPWNIWSFLRGLTAPVFLMVSGAAHVFAMKRDADGRMTQQLVRRRTTWALTILGVAYLMIFPANRIFDLPFVESTVWKTFLQVNILQLTAVTLLGMVCLSRITRSVESLGKWALTIGGGILLLTPFVHALDAFALLPEPIAAFISYKHGSLFPVFPFSAFMFLGVAIGAFLKRFATNSERTEYLKKRGVFAASGVFALAGIIYGIYAVLPLPAMEAQMVHPAFMLMRVGIVLLLFTAAAFITEKTTNLNKHFSFFSAKSLHIYTIHLVLLYGTPWFNSVARWYPKAMTLEQGIGLVPAVICATLLIVFVADYIQKNVHKGDIVLRYSFGTVLVYALLR